MLHCADERDQDDVPGQGTLFSAQEESVQGTDQGTLFSAQEESVQGTDLDASSITALNLDASLAQLEKRLVVVEGVLVQYLLGEACFEQDISV